MIVMCGQGGGGGPSAVLKYSHIANSIERNALDNAGHGPGLCPGSRHAMPRIKRC